MIYFEWPTAMILYMAAQSEYPKLTIEPTPQTQQQHESRPDDMRKPGR
jgi:hypothetical protein